MLFDGRVISGVGGLYEVAVQDGDGERSILCRGRGVLRRDDEKILVGDLCVVREEGSEAVIEKLLPRRTSLIRPPLANLDLLFIVTAASHPAPSTDVLDKLTAIAVHNGITPVLIVTKADLDGTAAEALAATYRAVGFTVFVLSPSLDSAELSAFIDAEVQGGRTAAFAGT